MAPELQPAPPCGAGVRDVTRETTARSEDIRPVTIRRVPRLPGSRSPWRFSAGWVWEVRGTSPLPSVSPLVLQGLGTEGRRGPPTPLAPGVGSRPAPSPDRCHARVPSHFCGRKNGLLFCTLGWRGEGRLPFLSLNHTCNLLLSAPRAPEAPSSLLEPPRWPVPHALSLPTPDQPAAHSHSWCVARAPAASQTSWGKIHTHCLTSAQRSRPSPPGPPLLLVSPRGQCDSHTAFRPGSRRPGSPRPALAVLVRTLRATHPPPGGRDVALQGSPALQPGRRPLTLVTAAGGHLPPVWEAPVCSAPCLPRLGASRCM